MALIKGMTVTLFNKVQTGVDLFNAPIYSETPVTVNNVLVTPIASTSLIDSNLLHGKKTVYTLSIPKNDTNIWEDRTVVIFNQTFRTIGFCKEWMGDNVPLAWNKQIEVERYG